MLRLTSRAGEMFLQQSAAEQRRLLQTVIETATWEDGALRIALFEPFQILRHSDQESTKKGNGDSGVRTRFRNLAPQVGLEPTTLR
jgi:hypothetical protein